MIIALTAVTDRGLEREVNEDAFALCPDLQKSEWLIDRQSPLSAQVTPSEAGTLIAIADGMGGAAAGDVASQKAVESLSRQFQSSASPIQPAEREAFLKASIATIDEELKQHAIDHFETAGMGTTIVVAWMNAETVTLAWCGDSRCYLYRPSDGLSRLTHDHSYVQQLVDQGELHPDEAITHPDSNVITRCLGDTDTATHPDTTSLALEEGDMLLLCTDGLCGYINDKAIGDIVQRHYPDTEATREALLRAALAAGGYDNITIALALLSNSVNQRQPSFLGRLFHCLKNPN